MRSEDIVDRRSFLLNGLAVTPFLLGSPSTSNREPRRREVVTDSRLRSPINRSITLEAKPAPLTLDTATTAVLVVDMQNDFGAKGGMFERAGIDISVIRSAIRPTAKVLTAARQAGIKVIYLKMGYRPDLSDLGAPDSVNRARHLHMGVGKPVRAPSDPGHLEYGNPG